MDQAPTPPQAPVRTAMLLIDAYNVIGARWVLPPPLRPEGVPALLGLIARSRYAHRRIRVVCDGRPGPDWRHVGILETGTGLLWTRLGRAEILFSGKGREADDVIEAILAARGGLAILVVSSDRRLIQAAGRAGADQIGNGAFLRQLGADLGGETPDAREAAPLDRNAVEGWMREFGFEPIPRGPAPASPQPPRPTPPSSHRPAAFGERLSIPGPSGAPAYQAGGETPGAREVEPLDPLLAAAFEEWRGRLSADDLDMTRWIRGVEPIRDKDGPAGRGRRR